MIGMTISEFMTKVYYGDEIEFIKNDTTYFVQGFYEDRLYHLTVDYWNKTDGTEPEHGYLLSLHCASQQERLSQFEQAPIFDGKTIYEIESEITVLYG